MASSQKTFNGDYQINLGPFGNSAPGVIGDGEGYMIVNGNLIVRGTTQSANVLVLETTYPFILAGEDNPGPANPAGYGNLGLVVQTGGSNVLPTYAAIQFNGNINAWQISSNVTSGNTGAVGTYANILTSTSGIGVAGSNTWIQFNDNGSFGANAALIFDVGNNTMGLDGKLRLDHLAATPANVPGSTVLYANSTGSGGSGLYFVDSDNTQDELVSKAKAIVYSIIF